MRSVRLSVSVIQLPTGGPDTLGLYHIRLLPGGTCQGGSTSPPPPPVSGWRGWPHRQHQRLLRNLPLPLNNHRYYFNSLTWRVADTSPGTITIQPGISPSLTGVGSGVVVGLHDWQLVHVCDLWASLMCVCVCVRGRCVCGLLEKSGTVEWNLHRPWACILSSYNWGILNLR